MPRASQLLSYVNALARIDPSYPADYARGVLLYRSGRPAEAARAFSRHLEVYPDGPWTLRARNFWLAAQGQR
jgi:TolA-binding protein